MIGSGLDGWGGTKDRRMWDEMREKWLLWLYYHFPILLLGFSYDAYMMLLSCSYVGGCIFLFPGGGWKKFTPACGMQAGVRVFYRSRRVI